MDKALKEAIERIENDRLKILEDYIQFWIAAKIPSPIDFAMLADRIVLCHQTTAEGTRSWLEFKKEWLD